jgi:hypothetical protein
MSVTRVPQFPELVIKRTPALARSDLACASFVDVFSLSGNSISQASQIASLSGNANNQAAQISQLSGNAISQSTQIAAVSAGLANAGVPRSEVVAVSAGLYAGVVGLSADIVDLDLSLTQSIATTCITTSRITGATTTIVGFLTVQISGATYKLGIIA